MKCPYCGEEMTEGILIGDGREKVRWQAAGEKIGVMDRMVTTVGCVNARYKLFGFEIDGNYCKKCKKLIIDTDVK